MPPLRRRDTTVAVAGAAAAAFGAWYWTTAVHPPRLVAAEGSTVAAAVRERCPTLTSPYKPTPWATNPHVQTLLTRLRGALAADAGYTRQLLADAAVPAGGGVAGALDWFRGSDSPDAAPAAAPVLLVLHGLGGDSAEGHCRHACAAAAAAGWRAAVLVHRGGPGLPLTSAALTTAGATADVKHALTTIADRFPGAPLLAIGYSMGGLTLAAALAEVGGGGGGCGGAAFPPLAGAVIVSSPFDPAAVVAAADAAPAWSPSRLYGAFLAGKVREFVVRHADALAAHGGLDVAALQAQAAGSGQLAPLLDALVAAGGGHAGFAAAAAAADAAAHVPAIRTPTLFITAADDPLVRPAGAAAPEALIAANPATVLAVTSRGGHMAFLQGAAGVLGASWAEAAAMEFLALWAPRGAPLSGREGGGAGGGGAAAADDDDGVGGGRLPPSRSSARPNPYARPPGAGGGAAPSTAAAAAARRAALRTDHLGSPVPAPPARAKAKGKVGAASAAASTAAARLTRVAASAAGGLAGMAEGAPAPAPAPAAAAATPAPSGPPAPPETPPRAADVAAALGAIAADRAAAAAAALAGRAATAWRLMHGGGGWSGGAAPPPAPPPPTPPPPAAKVASPPPHAPAVLDVVASPPSPAGRPRRPPGAVRRATSAAHLAAAA